MAKIFNMEQLKARMLIGTKEEMTELLEVVDNQQLSKLEKKIYKTLLQFKLEKFKESNDSMDELIKEIGDLDLPNQAKMHMFRAEILEKLYIQKLRDLEKESQLEEDLEKEQKQKEDLEKEAYRKEDLEKESSKQRALKSLRKALKIFRDLSNENNPYFGEHHFYLQIGDSFQRFQSYELALQCYQYIFETKEKYFIYPNDWAIRIASYYKYFEITQLIYKKLVDQKLFENCQNEINQQKRNLVDQFKLDYYMGVNCLLNNNIDEGLKFLKKSEKEYFDKNKMKRNNKLINYVNKFINIKDPFDKEDNLIENFNADVYAIWFVPQFIQMHKDYEKIVKMRLENLNKEQSLRNEGLNNIGEIKKKIVEQQDLSKNDQNDGKKSIEEKISQYKEELLREEEKFNQKFKQDLFEVDKYFQQFQYRPHDQILSSLEKILLNIPKIKKKKKVRVAQNIDQYCCFEFIQVECFNFARNFLDGLTDQGFIVVYILIFFSSIQEGMKYLVFLSNRNLNYVIPNCETPASEQFLKILKFLIDQITQQNDVDEYIKQLNKELITNLEKYFKEEYYDNLLTEVDKCQFYDPYVYELKDVLYTYLFKRKKENLQAIFTNGETYVEILSYTKDSWEVNKKQIKE